MTDWIVLGGGCFWCLEAVFIRVDGVASVVSGYAGGEKENPSYREVCTGRTGHAEVVKVEFDTGRISLDEVLNFFFKAHDPTTPNRQGADVGTQYRSVILYRNKAQQEAAEAAVERAGQDYADPVVTEVKPLKEFYPAEEYHQNYFKRNPQAPYCRAVINPKVRKIFNI
ncbi:MAG: peptide-methionine (S)-S-oxide reductase MsrA [Spirochaetia bacterium]